MSNFMCSTTGRCFSSIEAIQSCKASHSVNASCDECPWIKTSQDIPPLNSLPPLPPKPPSQPPEPPSKVSADDWNKILCSLKDKYQASPIESERLPKPTYTPKPSPLNNSHEFDDNGKRRKPYDNPFDDNGNYIVPSSQQTERYPRHPDKTASSLFTTCFWLVLLAIVIAVIYYANNGINYLSSHKDDIVSSVSSVAGKAVDTANQYKDDTVNKINSLSSSTPTPQLSSVATTTPIATPKTTTTTPIPTLIPAPTPKNSYKNYLLGLVKEPTGTTTNSYGDFVILINNTNSINPTYAQLVSFLQNDNTDRFPYQYAVPSVGFYYGTAESKVDLKLEQDIIDGIKQPNPPRLCVDFAERLHNIAERAGLKCAFVCVDLNGYTDTKGFGIPSNTSHALNAFNTSDKGIIYIDSTSCWTINDASHPIRSVSRVDVAVGKQYIPQSMFPETGWKSSFQSMGMVTNIFTTWDGNWNN